MLSINDLSRELSAQRALWTANENPISLLSEQQRKAILSQVEPNEAPPFEEDTEIAQTFSPLVDWRNRNGNHITSVKKQGSCATCVAFSTVSVTESMVSIEMGQLLDLSEADIFFCSSHGANRGAWYDNLAFDEIKRRGVCGETDFPYASAFPNGDISFYHNYQGQIPPPDPACIISPRRNNSVVKITGIHNLSSNQAEVKNYISATGPVTCSMVIYEDFLHYTSGIYHHVAGVFQGLHTVQLIGYSEAGQYWICKNSWDTSWGMSGFFNIAYGECSIDFYQKIGITGVILPTNADTHRWNGFENLGGTLTSRPNAVSWAADRIDVVTRGLDSSVWYKWKDGENWYGWESLGGQIQGAPAICSWAEDRLDIFAMGLNHHLFHKWYQGGWSGWEDFGGLLSSEPACVSWGNNRIDIFARGMNSSLLHKWWDGSNWNGWEDLGGVIAAAAPAVASCKPGRLDCFATGSNNHIWHKWFENGWSDWEDLGAEISGSPAAVSSEPGRIDLFFKGMNYNLIHKWWEGENWSADEDLGGLIASDIGLSSWAPGRIDCFIKGTDSALYHKWFQ